MSLPLRNSDLRPSGHNTAKTAANNISPRMNHSAMPEGLHHGGSRQNSHEFISDFRRFAEQAIEARHQALTALRSMSCAATSDAFASKAAYSLPKILAQNRTAASTCD